jgi:hypothetical protein
VVVLVMIWLRICYGILLQCEQTSPASLVALTNKYPRKMLENELGDAGGPLKRQQDVGAGDAREQPVLKRLVSCVLA